MGRKLDEQAPGVSPGDWADEAPAPPRRTWPLYAVVAVLAVAAAFVTLRALDLLPWQGESRAVPAPEPLATAPPAEATPAPTAPPEPDFEAIFRHMNATLNIAWQTRRSELVDQIYSPACECHSIVKGDIQAHLESGIVPQGVSIVVHRVELLERPSPDEARLRIVREVKPYVLRDERGQKLEERPGRSATSYVVILRREGDRWLVHSFTEEGGA